MSQLIKGILFDVFGTLIRITYGESAQVIRQYILNNGYEIDKAEFGRQWKSFYREAIKAGMPFQREADIFTARIQSFYSQYHVNRNAAEDYQGFFRSACKREAYPDVAGCLETFKKQYPVYLASNTDNDVLQAVLSHNNIQIKDQFTSEGLQYYKPNPLFYEKLLKEIPYQPSELLFVGDSMEEDILMPKKLGLKTALIDRDNRYPDTGIQADIKIASLAALPKAILMM